MYKSRRIIVFLIILIFVSVCFTGCKSKVIEETTTAVNAYNEKAGSINTEISVYNNSVQGQKEKNAELESIIDEAQLLLENDEIPFDEQTEIDLIDAIDNAQANIVENQDEIDTLPILEVNEETDIKELEALKEQAQEELNNIDSIDIPAPVATPDYSSDLDSIETAQIAYKDSCTSMAQITAPEDEFVMDRIKTIDILKDIKPVTEEADPNGLLNKQGGYIGCIYFIDSQVDTSNIFDYTEDSLVVGVDGGGAIEIYETPEGAEKRNDYLASYDGTIFRPGSHYVYGTLVIRTSDYLTGTQQKELTDIIVNSLTEIK